MPIKSTFLVPILWLFALTASGQIYDTIDFSNQQHVNKFLKKEFDKPFGIIIENINKKVYNITLDNTSETYHANYSDFLENISSIAAPATAEPDAPPAVVSNPVAGTEKLITDRQLNRLPDSPLKDKLNDLNSLYAKIDRQRISDKDILSDIKDLHSILFKLRDLNGTLDDLSFSCSSKLEDLNNIVMESLNTFVQATDSGFLRELRKHDVPESKREYSLYFRDLSRRAHFNMRAHKLNYEIMFSDKRKSENSIQIDSLKSMIRSISIELSKGKGDVYESISKKLNVTVTDYITIANQANYDYAAQFDMDYLTEAYLMLDSREINQLIFAFNYFTKSHFTYVVPAQKLDMDIHTYKINILPKDSIPCDAPIGYIDYKIRTKKGLKIDISSGIIANLDWFGFENKTFRKIEVDDSQSRIVANENRNILFPTIAAFAHIYSRSGENFNYGGVFGVSTSASASLGFHPGFSLLFGSKQRFIINMGVTIGQVDLLAEPLNEEDLFPTGMVPDVIPTQQFYRAGVYLGISYNL